MKQQLKVQRKALRDLVKTHRKEFSLIAGLCGLSFVLGWLWHGMWLIAALCLLHLIGQWGRYTEERLASSPENTRVGLYQRIWGEDWQRALSRDHPQLLGKSQEHSGGLLRASIVDSAESREDATPLKGCEKNRPDVPSPDSAAA